MQPSEGTSSMSQAGGGSTPPPARRPSGVRGAMESRFENLIFASRWLQAPLYAGLIVASVLYAYRFAIEVYHLVHSVFVPDPLKPLTEEDFLLMVLGLVDVTMVANLIAMVVIGGYTTFVSHIDLENHPDRPEWLQSITAGTLKIKLVSSLVSISGIHLLKTFIDVGAFNDKHELEEPDRVVLWKVIIHMVFLLSSIMLTFSEKIAHEHHME